MIRGRLISPTNLMLEHPMLSPVKESEFAIVGLKEYEESRRDWIRYGVMIGIVGAIVVAGIFATIAGALR